MLDLKLVMGHRNSLFSVDHLVKTDKDDNIFPRSSVVDHVDGQTLSKTIVAWTGNLKETEDIEIKLDKTTEPDGALIYGKVFIKIAVSISSAVRVIC